MQDFNPRNSRLALSPIPTQNILKSNFQPSFWKKWAVSQIVFFVFSKTDMKHISNPVWKIRFKYVCSSNNFSINLIRTVVSGFIWRKCFLIRALCAVFGEFINVLLLDKLELYDFWKMKSYTEMNKACKYISFISAIIKKHIFSLNPILCDAYIVGLLVNGLLDRDPIDTQNFNGLSTV